MSEASTPKPVTKEAIKKKSNDECIELKNIKYQTMLINNNMDLSRKKETTNISNIEDFLMKEREYNKKQPWSKLGEGSKMKIRALRNSPKRTWRSITTVGQVNRIL